MQSDAEFAAMLAREEEEGARAAAARHAQQQQQVGQMLYFVHFGGRVCVSV